MIWKRIIVKCFFLVKMFILKKDVDTFSLAACLRIEILDEENVVFVSKENWEYYLESDSEENFEKRNWVVKF